MDKLEKVNKLIEKAKENYANISNNIIPGIQGISVEGVDLIPLGGDAKANHEEPNKKSHQ